MTTLKRLIWDQTLQLIDLPEDIAEEYDNVFKIVPTQLELTVWLKRREVKKTLKLLKRVWFKAAMEYGSGSVEAREIYDASERLKSKYGLSLEIEYEKQKRLQKNQRAIR